MENWEEIEKGIWVPKPKEVPAPAAPAESVEKKREQSYLDHDGHWKAVPSSSLPTSEDRARAREEVAKAHEHELEESRKAREAFLQAEAKRQCESMTVVGPDGKIDHTWVQMLQQVVARDKTTGEIDWVVTKAKRDECLTAYEWVKEHGLRYKI